MAHDRIFANVKTSNSSRSLATEQVLRAISVPLARVTRGQPRLLGIIRVASSAPLTGVTARLPKLIVRVRFSSPAPRTKAQAREVIPALGLRH